MRELTKKDVDSALVCVLLMSGISGIVTPLPPHDWDDFDHFKGPYLGGRTSASLRDHDFGSVARSLCLGFLRDRARSQEFWTGIGSRADAGVSQHTWSLERVRYASPLLTSEHR